MKKLSRLILISVPFLAFSSVSFGSDNNTNDDVVIKVNSTTPVYLKSDNQSVASPASAEGNTIVVDKNATHSTTLYDSEMHPIHTVTWSKEGEHAILVGLNPVGPSKDAPKAEAAVNPAEQHTIDVTIHDSPATTGNDEPLSLQSVAAIEPAPNAVPDPSANMLTPAASTETIK